MSFQSKKNHPSKYQTLRRNAKSARDDYKKLYLTAFQLLLPRSDNCHCLSCPIENKNSPPIFSSITSINEPTKLRFAIGSHNCEMKNKKVILHNSTVVEVTVPISCSAIFFHDRTIHGGGSSQTLNIRMFGLHCPKDQECKAENKNYTRIVTECEKGCSLCRNLLELKVSNGNKFFPVEQTDLRNVKILDQVNDYNLKDHGFAIVKVAFNPNASVSNQATKLGMDLTKGLKFHSIGQDEINSSENNRGILSLGSKLCSEIVMKKFVTSSLDDYLEECQMNICKYLENQYGVNYNTMDRTLLRSKGSIGNQMLHLDGLPDCTCE